MIEQWFYSLPLRLRSFFHPNKVDQELQEELREHLEQQIKENVARGVAGGGALLRRAYFGRHHADRTAVPRRSRRERAGGLCSGFAVWVPTTVPQPGL